MRDLIMFYGITIGRRYTKKQKAIFVEHSSKEAKRLGFDVQLQSKKGKVHAINNLIIGDLEHADKVVVAAYDTPSKMYVPDYNYYPFNASKNMQQEKLNFFLQTVLGFLAVILAYILWYQVSTYAIFFQALTILVCLCLLGFAYSMFKGKANRCNFNRNSISVALMMSLMSDIDKKNKIAYVFLDQAVNSYEGLRFLCERLDHQEVLLLDCLANGDMVVCAHTDAVDVHSIIQNNNNVSIYDKCYASLTVQHNVLSIYKQMLCLVSGDMQDKQFIVKHTRSKHDYHVDIESVENLKKVIINYLQG